MGHHGVRYRLIPFCGLARFNVSGHGPPGEVEPQPYPPVLAGLCLGHALREAVVREAAILPFGRFHCAKDSGF